MTITHLCPPEGSGTMPCCGRSPFEVPRTHRMTEISALVTCVTADQRLEAAAAVLVRAEGAPHSRRAQELRSSAQKWLEPLDIQIGCRHHVVPELNCIACFDLAK